MDSIPEKIYLQMGDDFNPNEFTGSFKELNEVSWCADKIYDHDIEYVLASKVDAERHDFENKIEGYKGIIEEYKWLVKIAKDELIRIKQQQTNEH